MTETRVDTTRLQGIARAFTATAAFYAAMDVELFTHVGSTRGEFAPPDGLRRHPGNTDGAVRRVDDDVGDVGLEEPGGELPGLGDHGFGGAAYG